MLPGRGVTQTKTSIFQFLSILLQLLLLFSQLSNHNTVLLLKRLNFQAQRPGVSALGFAGQVLQAN